MKSGYKKDNFDEEVYSVVAMIPPGKVLSYGRIAELMGMPLNSRRVGAAMRGAPAELPCHRVVNSQGRTAPGCPSHIEMLAEEGVAFRRNGCVNMARHAWKVEDEY